MKYFYVTICICALFLLPKVRSVTKEAIASYLDYRIQYGVIDGY